MEVKADSRGYWYIQPTAEKRTTKTFGHRSKISKAQAQILANRWLQDAASQSSSSVLTVGEVLQAYLAHAEKIYSVGEADNIEYALKPLNKAFGAIDVRDFRPVHLRDYRDMMAEKLARTTVNARLIRVKRAMKWAARQELITEAQYASLNLVEPCRRGLAREPDAIEPVDEATIEATCKHLPATVAAMVRLQRLTSMRPEEVCRLTPTMIDRNRLPWVATFKEHKTKHHGKKRVIAIGPKARKILAPILAKAYRLHRPIFSPVNAIAERRGKRPKSKRITDRYTTRSYRRAIEYACDAAGIPHWAPNRLRHAALNAIEKSDGMDAARAVAGHTAASTTEIYVQRDQELMFTTIERVG